MSEDSKVDGRSVAIMQPYFAPYLGYFNLIAATDVFVFHDDVKYTKKGWINRNRICDGDSSKIISVSIAKDSDFRKINERITSQSFNPSKLHNEIREFLKKLRFSKDSDPFLSSIETNVAPNSNLAASLINLVKDFSSSLDLQSHFLNASDFELDPKLSGEARVLEICKLVGATIYVNPPGGEHLYSSQKFQRNGLTLAFLQPNVLESETNKEIETSSILSYLAHFGLDNTIARAKTGFMLK